MGPTKQESGYPVLDPFQLCQMWYYVGQSLINLSDHRPSFHVSLTQQ